MDHVEALLHLHKTYDLCSGGHKVFLMGFSMGANLMTNAIAHIDSEITHNLAGFKQQYGLEKVPTFTAACIVQAPFRTWLTYKSLSQAANGFFDKVLTGNLCRVLLKHESKMKDRVKEVCGVDIASTIEAWKKEPKKCMNLQYWDDTFQYKLFGFDSTDDYR